MQRRRKSNQVGDIFYCQMKKPVAGLNAAFVMLALKRCLLHYHDLGPNFPTEIHKTCKRR
jgi:ribonuclease G